MSQHQHKDYAGAKLGMWLFLFTELLLFGGLFLLYAVYLKRYPHEFAAGGTQLDWIMGTANTVILLTSSLFAAMAVTAVQRDERRRAVGLIGGTILCAAGFMVDQVRRVERQDRPRHLSRLRASEGRAAGGIGLLQPLLHDHRHPRPACADRRGAAGLDRGQGQGGQRSHAGNFVLLENGALYWHLVDLIWIFIFPLYYLIL